MDMTGTTRFQRVRIAVWMLAVLFALGSIAEAGSAVLCISQNGHMDVEYSLAGCCIVASASGDQIGSPMVLSDSSGCDGCVDLQFGKNALKTGKKILSGPEPTVSRSFAPHGDSGAMRVSAIVESTVQDGLVAAISSVVLLV